MSKAHWTDSHIKELDTGEFMVEGVRGLAHATCATQQLARESLVKYVTFTLNAGSEAYKLPSLLSKVLKKVQELCMVYYISANGTVLLRWDGVWTEYHKVALKDSRLMEALR